MCISVFWLRVEYSSFTFMSPSLASGREADLTCGRSLPMSRCSTNWSKLSTLNTVHIGLCTWYFTFLYYILKICLKISTPFDVVLEYILLQHVLAQYVMTNLSTCSTCTSGTPVSRFEQDKPTDLVWKWRLSSTSLLQVINGLWFPKVRLLHSKICQFKAF